MPSLAEILADPRLNGVYRTEGAIAGLPGLVRLDARRLTGKEGLLTALGTALDLPDYYGANWDALEECLNDLSWRRGSVVVLIEHAAALDAGILENLLEIWRDAAAMWSGEGRIMVLLLAGMEASALPLAE